MEKFNFLVSSEEINLSISPWTFICEMRISDEQRLKDVVDSVLSVHGFIYSKNIITCSTFHTKNVMMKISHYTFAVRRRRRCRQLTWFCIFTIFSFWKFYVLGKFCTQSGKKLNVCQFFHSHNFLASLFLYEFAENSFAIYFH